MSEEINELVNGIIAYVDFFSLAENWRENIKIILRVDRMHAGQ